MEMKISGPTIQALAEIIMGGGDGTKPGYRSGPDLVTFFYSFGSTDIYGAGFPSRKEYTTEKIKEYNGTNAIYDIIKLALPAVDLDKETPETANKFNNQIKKDGYQIIPIKSEGLISDTGYITYGNFLEFDVRPLNGKTVEIDTAIKLNHQFINEQISKAKTKLASGDFDGAITNCYSLLEELLKELLRKKVPSFKPDEGDIRTLYKLLAEAMNLNPKGENMESYLKTILEGLNKQVSGLFTLANKSSDRHAQKYKPKGHHAKLAVNATFSLCEFLLDSFEYQQSKQDSQNATETKQREIA
jgi:hypothetical protein